jgi:S-DNA-T family DNA segregation ATPase FtsK/SpoIIIE
LSELIGIVLLAAGLLLLVAQLSFDPHDLAAHRNPPNQTPHNWIGAAGAWGANLLFQWFGAGAFVLPFLLLVFGTGYLFEMFSYLQRRWAWAAVLFVSSLSFFELYAGLLKNLCKNINAPSAGGYIGTFLNDYIFGHFGVPGATIILLALYAISLLYLTNFRLGQWLRAVWARSGKDDDKDWTPEEKELARKAKDLEKQARKLQEQVERSGLGPDLKPVPAPQVRDLSIPQARGKGKARVPEPEPEKLVAEGEVITAREIAAATTDDILGKGKPAVEVPAGAEPVAAAASPDPKIHDNTRSKPKKPKPISVAAAPAIGNYQLPPMDFLQMPDATLKPTESKEELMANARLMQGTLAQFGIEVALGDITKGPTITRYELHPAPGVKMERITALNSNIAAALKAERIHILAPVPGKSSVGVEVPNAVKTKVIMRDLLESEEWVKTRPVSRWRSARTCMATRSSPIFPTCRTC